ncbi:MAG: hypothetical protein JNM19_10110 [Chitinophagaceae bacterium]|nr:hypothetical protein [Chitinophagaceae bacterium]
MKCGLLTAFLFLIQGISFSQVDSIKPPPSPNKRNTQKGIYDKVEKEATFPGGDVAFKNFLLQNLQFISDSASRQGIKKDTYTIGLMFMIDTAGKVFAVKAEGKPRQQFLEKASMHMIEKSPLWEPAIQNGRIIKAYRFQPLTITVE